MLYHLIGHYKLT